MKLNEWFYGLFHKNNDELMEMVTCPACSSVTNVEIEHNSGIPRTYVCNCGCTIDSEIGFYRTPEQFSTQMLR
jgi:hypothetical protein